MRMRPDGPPISWSLRDRLVVFGAWGLFVAAINIVGVLARRDDSGRLYTKTWYWIDATPYLTAVPAVIITAALAFAVLVPLYRWRFGGGLVGVLVAALVAVEYYLFAKVVGPVWQGPRFERWQVPLLGVVLAAVAIAAAVSVQTRVLGAKRPGST